MNHIKKAFTLVELLVVITILAILGTIAFVSLQGYSRDSRNSVRISDLKTTEKALELYSLQTGNYPEPDNNTIITTGTGTQIELWNKGEFDTGLLTKLKKINKLPRDPKTDTLIEYSTTLQRKEYELKYDLELAAASPSPIRRGIGVRSVQANSTTPYVKGTYNGVFLVGKDKSYYAVPGLFTGTGNVTDPTTFDLHEQQVDYQVQTIKTASGVTITTTTLKDHYQDFTQSLKTILDTNPDLRGGIYDTVLNLDTNKYEDFAKALTTGDTIVLANLTQQQEQTPASSSYNISNSALFDGVTGRLFKLTSFGDSMNQFAFSFWVHPLTGGIGQTVYGIDGVDVYNAFDIGFQADDTFRWGDFVNPPGVIWQKKTSAKYRDYSSWMHCFLSVDGNTIKVYINGKEITDFSGNTNPSLGYSSSYINSGSGLSEWIGYSQTTANYSKFYLADFIRTDGVIPSITDFGEFNSITGRWEPKAYTGTYGTNGFKLDFSNASNLGEDSSGNGNDWVVSPTGVTQISDTPTNNYATWNPLAQSDNPTLSDGNTVWVSEAGFPGRTWATMSLPKTGKWYWEIQQTSGTYTSSAFGAGVADYSRSNHNIGGDIGVSVYEWGFHTGGWKAHNGITSYGASINQNNALMIAVDMDAGEMYLGETDGTTHNWFGSSDPTTNTLPAFSTLLDTLVPVIVRQTSTVSAKGLFAEDEFLGVLPTGFKALSTANLPEVNDKLENHYKAVTYNGTGVNQSITGVGFKPDFLWIKARNEANSHQLYDSIRGAPLSLSTNGDWGEISQGTQGVLSFNLDGFSLGDGPGINRSGNTHVTYAFNLLNDTSGMTTGGGTSQSYTAKYNQVLGMSIVKYIGNGTSGHQIPHHGGGKPFMVIIKKTSGTETWPVYHEAYGATKYLTLNSTNATTTNSTVWNDTEPTDSVVILGYGGIVNDNTQEYLMISFFETDFMKPISYIGNGLTDGTFVDLGIQPEFMITKNSNDTRDWVLTDNLRNTINPIDKHLRINTSDAEITQTIGDYLSTGYKIRIINANYNTSGHQYIGLAIGTPTQNSNAK